MENYEEVKPLLYDKAKLVKQPATVYRTNIGQRRYYYSFRKNRLVRVPSVTTIIAAEMKQSEWLIRWIAQYGYRQAMEKRDRAGDYGTLFTIVAAQYFIERRIDLDTLQIRIDTFKATNNIDYPTPYWNFRLREDLYALHEFVIDYEVQPIAIELMLFSEKGFAGAIDAVVEMTVGTGQNMRILKSDKKYDKKTGELIQDKTRRITALIDWKSGRHGFYPSNEAQLHFYKHLWEENFPHLPLEAVFNWSPKEWADGTTSLYNLKEQSDSLEAKRIWNYLENFKISDKSAEKKFKRIEGVLEFGKRNGHLKMETFQERINRIHGFENEETNDKSATSENVAETLRTPQKTTKETKQIKETKNTKQTELLEEVNNLISHKGDKS